MLNTCNNNKEMQFKYLDDDTYNFLIQLRVISLGSYYSLLTITKSNTRSGKRFMKETQRYWPAWLAEFKPNIFQIALCVRKGYLTTNETM